MEYKHKEIKISRVAMALGKQGIGMFTFPDRENKGNLPKNIKNMIVHREIFEVLKIEGYTRVLVGFSYKLLAL